MGILGVLSLSGLLIKNAIVLVDQMDMETREVDGAKEKALLTTAASRFRPVMLGTLTTVLGVAPQLFVPFFKRWR